MLEELRKAHTEAVPSSLADAQDYLLNGELDNLHGVLCGDIYAATSRFALLAHTKMPALLLAAEFAFLYHSGRGTPAMLSRAAKQVMDALDSEGEAK